MNRRFISPRPIQLFSLLEYLSGDDLELRLYHYGESRRLQEAGPETAVLHLRWLLNPALGLPLQPFTISTRPRDAALTTPGEYAALEDWDELEIVGLPVDDSWAASGYVTDDQGLVDDPLPPYEAALERLTAGAPVRGWSTTTDRGGQMPEWEPPDLSTLLSKGVIEGLLPGIQEMLETVPPLSPRQHKDYRRPKRDFKKPYQVGFAENPALRDKPSKIVTMPWPVLLMAAASDPFSSLALGFGTLLRYDPELVYRVSVYHSYFDVEYSAVVIDPPNRPPPEPPQNVQAERRAHNRPLDTDLPYTDTVDVRWERPQLVGVRPDPKYIPLSYAVGRIGPDHFADILLPRRAGGIGGWTPYLPAASQRPDPFIHFTEKQLDAGRRPTTKSCVYNVAVQDLFGRWSRWGRWAGWASADYDLAADPVQTPRVADVRLDSAGKLTADFSWDWSDRSPEFIELSGRFSDPAGPELLRVRLDFGGEAAGQVTQGAATLSALDPQRRSIIPQWGSAQDGDPSEPGVRYYRLEARLPVSFTQSELVFELTARGQDHLHFKYLPPLGISPWSAPVQVRLLDPNPPDWSLQLSPRETPLWASLADVTGASRMKLTWPAAPGLRYFVYTASETALLSDSSPDYSQPYSDRVHTLRALLAQPGKRARFRRLQETALERPEYEAELPHGSRVLHVFAVLAVNDLQVESLWPTNPQQFFIVGAPRLAPPAEPALLAEADATGVVTVTVRLRAGNPAARVEVFRSSRQEQAAEVDLMGPPVASLPVNGGPTLEFQEPLSPSWRPVFYRAVAWSADDEAQGLVGGRSPASAPAAVSVLPGGPPDLDDLRVNEPGSTAAEVLVSVRSTAPVEGLVYGPHHLVVEAWDADGNRVVRQEGDLPGLPTAADRAQVPFPGAGPRPVVRVPETGSPASRYYTWISRPAAGQPFHLAVKLIDPLGRIASLEADVPVLEQLPMPEFGPLSAQAFHHLELGNLLAVRIPVVSTIWPGQEGEYTLSLVAARPDQLGFARGIPPRLQATLAAIPTALNEPEAAELLRERLQRPQVRIAVVRVGDAPGPPYIFAAWARQVTPAVFMAALTDPLGQVGRAQVNVNG